MKFCFVIHPLSLEDVARYEPGAAGKGAPIVRKIMEWMPPWATAHITGVQTPDGRETEGWFVTAPLLPEQMMEFPREEVYKRIVRAIEIGAELGAEVAGLGAFTGVVGDGGITVAERSPIPVTTGNSLTIAAGIQSFFRGAREMGVDPATATVAIVGATGSIGSACAKLIAPHVKHMVLVARNNTRLQKFYEQMKAELPCELSYTSRHLRRGAPLAVDSHRDIVDARRHSTRGSATGRGRLRTVVAARREPPRGARASRRARDRGRQYGRARSSVFRARARAGKCFRFEPSAAHGTCMHERDDGARARAARASATRSAAAST